MQNPINYMNIIKLFIGILLTISMYYGVIQDIMINIVILSYLLIKTINSIENKDDEDENKDVKDNDNIKKMWVIYTCFVSIDYLLGIIFSIIPFGFTYQFMRVFMILYSNKLGSDIVGIYNILIKVIYKRYNKIFNNYVNTFDAYKNYINNKFSDAYDISKDIIKEFLKNHQEIVNNHLNDNLNNHLNDKKDE